MFRQGDQVVYSVHGVCSILENEFRVINRKKVEYYVLQPLEQPEARYYVPVQNAAAVAKISPILTKQEVELILRGNSIRSQEWIADENQRKLYYKTLISSGDRAALIGTVRLLHQHKKDQQAAGHKFHLSDENFLRDAEKLLSGELSVALDIPRSEVGAYIRRCLDGCE